MGQAIEALSAVVEGALAGSGLEVVDVEAAPGVIRVLVDQDGGVDLEALTRANALVSDELDRHDDLVPGGAYGLEVSSPGIERPLRKPEHFAKFVGSTVAIRTNPGVAGERRVTGRLAEAGDLGITVETGSERRHLSYQDIERARTVFEWGNSASPVKRSSKNASRKGVGKA